MACFCAVRDVSFAIDALALRDSFPVIAGDNLLDYSLSDFIAYSRKKQIACVMRYYEPGMKKLRKTGVTVVDEEGKILSMEEKPAEPKSHWCTPPFYIYKASYAGLVKVGIESGCDVDAPCWLCLVTWVHTF